MGIIKKLSAGAVALAAVTAFGAGPAQAAPKPTSGQAAGARTGQVTMHRVSKATLAASDDCPSGYSCYYDGHFGTSKIWTAPTCGFFNIGQLPGALADRISSIVNYGGGPVQAYNWVGSWVAIGAAVPVGWEADYRGAADNIIDGIYTPC